MAELIIRHVEDADYEHIAELYDSRSVMAQTSQLPYRSADFWRPFYRSRSADCIELVALYDGHIAGHLGILPDSRVRCRHVCSFGLAVHRDRQRRGIGKALMTELIRLADEWMNMVRIELDVATTNEGAIALYRNFDFEIEGESRYAMFTNGSYSHSYRMARIHPGVAESRQD